MPEAPPATTAPASQELTRHYVKLCDRRDFDDPELRAMLREIVPGRTPAEEIERKLWEYAMLGLFLRDVGALRDDAAILSVAAGHEEPLYWLANRVARVVATDIYGEGGFAEREAEGSMLANPAAFAPYRYREDHLEVHSMDARRLDLPDATFDAVFSLSSIEHFGGPRDIAAAAREIGRVLKPGGHAFIVTECLVRFHPLDVPLVQTAIRAATFGRRCPTATPRRRIVDAFTAGELRPRIVRPSGLELMQELDTTVSPESFENTTKFIGDVLEHPSGNRFPHIMLQAHGAPWTSACLALRKPLGHG